MNLNTLKKNDSNTILFHSIIWCFFIVASLIQFYEGPFRINSDFYAQWISGIVLFYLNYFYFIPLFLLEKKYWHYLACILGLITVFMTLRILYFIPEFQMVIPKEFGQHKMMNGAGKAVFNDRFFHRKQPFAFKIIPSFFYILVVAISTIIKTLSEYYNNQQNELIAEAQRQAAELIYLRKQTNPHFLFNSLNSIYSLAHKKSDLVPDAIVTLSELMRYMLYETDNKFVFLEKEINYIQNYIELQKLRLNNIENITINIHGDTKNKFIEPLLLISFIENAFKYGTDYKGAAYVKIKITIVGTVLDFFVENKVEEYVRDPDNSGIGLSNIENRLNLLYPNAHQLTITESDAKYSVHLNLKLDKIQTSM
ncbi:sensor histidine kinase [Flavobacterium restrictum]|uniref:Histidine kinase n=1 Tax=Flavobacterium restrictum TaxID=2594428 RepID=A0A553EBE5_9FLAO|nr:sensor histidine kinase [Flavobacterium restrictum]TRX42366.1 histidine kinase [Flavobacterium restrictum]